jgi:hypothetical protein
VPRRPREHRLETGSQSAFQDALGDHLLFRPEHPDYGIDGDVEEFDLDDRATGLRFYVQLKATDEEELTIQPSSHFRNARNAGAPGLFTEVAMD